MSDYDFLAAFDEDDGADRTAQHASKREPADVDDKKSIASRLHLPELVVALVIAAILLLVPFAAHADEGANAASASASASASSSASTAQASASANTSDDGVSVSKQTTKLVSGKTIKTKKGRARGIVASNGATVIGGQLKVTTKGAGSPALVTSDATSGISLVSSKLSTAESESPLINCAGTIEIEDIRGRALASPAAQLVDAVSLKISNSTLTSHYTGIAKQQGIISGLTDAVTSGNTDAVSGTFIVAGTNDAGPNAAASSANATGAQAATSTTTLHINGSTINSSIENGALFYLTNTQAEVVLSNTELAFDSSAANLISVAGNNVEGWGTAGKNGAAVVFTCHGEQLAGNVSVDAISSLDFYLLGGTSWKGSCAIDATTTGDSAADNIVVNIDATSGWTLTANSTVTNLNLEPGAKLVDEAGDAVKIVDADGNTLVDGASDVQVKVMDSFSTAITTSSANELRHAAISRAAYDEKFGTSTEFGTNGEATSPSVEDKARELAARIAEWFARL